MQPNTDNVKLNVFHYKCGQNNNKVSVHIMEIGWNGTNLRKKLEENAMVRSTTLTIRGKIYDPRKIGYIMSALEGTQVDVLHLGNNIIGSDGAVYLANGLKSSNISILLIYNSNIGLTGIKYLSSALKYTSIRKLVVDWNGLGNEGMKFLADGLKMSNVTSLSVGDNAITFEGVRYLADALKDTNVISLDFSNDFGMEKNIIVTEGLEYLAKRLKDSNVAILGLKNINISDSDAYNLISCLKNTCVTSVSLRCNPVSACGLSQAANILKETQIAELRYDPCHLNHYDEVISEALCQNEALAKKIKEIFEKLVAQNTETHDLMFVIPNETQSKDMREYLFLITIMNDKPNVKGHIFNLIIENGFTSYPNIVKKINEFVTTVTNKFIMFINDCLPKIVYSFGEFDHVNLLKEFDDLKYHDIVKTFLLHRVLYYVDEEQEILHPRVYIMLHKYDMVLYNEQIEPNKREIIISYYQKHTDVDGAKELINLLQ